MDKSIWSEPNEIRICWITLLAMCDSDGIVEASIPGIAARAHLSLKDVEGAIKLFESPDPYSTNPANEGRRVERIASGFRVLNFCHYRQKDYGAAERMRRYRALRRNASPSEEPQPKAESKKTASISEQIPEGAAKPALHESSSFNLFWQAYPKPIGKVEARRAWTELQPDVKLFDAMITALAWQKKLPDWQKQNGRYIPSPAKWLQDRRWEIEPPASTLKPTNDLSRYDSWDGGPKKEDDRV